VRDRGRLLSSAHLPESALLRLAAYMDFRYRRGGEQLYAEVPFALFMAGLAPWFDRVLLLGRLDPEPGTLPHRLPSGIELVPLPFYEAASNPGALVRSLPGTIRCFIRALREVDAVLVFGPHPLSVLLVALAAAMRRKVVLGTRQHYPDYVRHRHPENRALHLAAGGLERAWRAAARFFPMVAVGPDLARSYRHSGRLLEVTVSLVRPEDVVTPSAALARSWDGELRVLSVGRLDAEKNPLLLADVLAAISGDDREWRLIICGDGAQREQLRSRLEQLGVAGQAELRGYVPVDGGLDRLYRDSHMLLHVSLTEGLPQVLFEAFASGLPVVATEVGGVGGGPEREALLLVPPADAAAAGRALERLARDGPLRERLVRRGLELARLRTLDAECRRLAAFIGAEQAR
jgi:glycosyltransferase involved in cell wall biosynthesis